MTNDVISLLFQQPIPIRQEAELAKAGKFNTDGSLKIDAKTGEPVQLPRKARAAWPKGSDILIKPTFDIGDQLMLAALERRSAVQLAKFAEADEVDTEALDLVLNQAQIYLAVFVLELRGSWLSDYTLAPSTDLPQRLKDVKKIPMQIAVFVLEEVQKRVDNPLPGTRTPIV